MTQRVKALGAKPDDFSSIPEIPRKKERTDSHKLSFGFHTDAIALVCAQVHSGTCMHALTYMHSCTQACTT